MNRNPKPADAGDTDGRPRSLAGTEPVSLIDPISGRLWELLGLYNAVVGTVLEADTTEALEQGVCAALTDHGGFAFACLGDAGAGDTPPSVRTVAGVNSRDAAAVAAAARSHVGPTDATTLYTVEQEVTVGGRSRRYDLAVVPVTHNGTRLGTLVVATTGPFSGLERSVLSSLGGYLGYAIVSLTRQETVADDTLIELSVELSSADADACPVASVAAETSSHLEYRGGVFTSAPGVTFLSVVDGDPAEIRAALGERPAVEETRTLADGCLEITSAATLPARLAALGASVGSATFGPGRMRATCRVPDTAAAKRVLDRVREICPGLTLTAKRRIRPGEADDAVRPTLPESLTDRQLEVLRTAYLSGFFDRPRETTGDEIAAMLDISSSTFHQHLRVALAKTLAATFGDG